MHYNKPYYISLVYLIGLAIGSIVFYKERMLFADPAFVTFEIINNKTFVISEHRYGAFITQLFPLISSLFDASLRVVLQLYSVSFYIFFLLVFYVSGTVLKQKTLAILFAFYLCFFVTDVYFWPNNEIHQSVGWMILFLSLYTYSEEKIWKLNVSTHIILVSTLFLSIISHVLILIPLLYLWAYKFIINRKYEKQINSFIIYSALIILFAGLRYYLSVDSRYDGYKLQGVKNISMDSILSAIRNDHSISIVQLVVKKYWVFSMVAITGIFTLIYKRKIILAFLTIGFIALFYLLVVLTHSAKITTTNLFYFESQWMCLTLIASAPFVYETMKHLGKYQITVFLFILLFLIKLPQLNESLTKFEIRLSHLQTLVDDAQKSDFQKSYIYKSKEADNLFFLTWGIPVETALLSSMTNGDKTVTVKPFGESDEITDNPNFIYTAFKLLPVERMNSQYFDFSSRSSYQFLYDE